MKFDSLIKQAMACLLITVPTCAMDNNMMSGPLSPRREAPLSDITNTLNQSPVLSPLSAPRAGDDAVVVIAAPVLRPKIEDVYLSLIEKRKWLVGTTEKPVILLDTETTGLGLDAEITQITMWKIIGGVSVETLNSYVKPKTRSISQAAVKASGLTREFLESHPPMELILDEVRSFIGNGICTGWNVSFDIGRLKWEFARSPGRKGEAWEIEWKDLRAMMRRDAHRNTGKIIESPDVQKTKTLRKSTARLERDIEERRKENALKKEKALERHLVKVAQGKKDATNPIASKGQGKKRTVDGEVLSFSQEATAKRYDMTADLGAALLNDNFKDVQSRHNVPKKRRDKRHDATYDTAEAGGLYSIVVAPVIQRLLEERAALLAEPRPVSRCLLDDLDDSVFPVDDGDL